ncbi:unnamed protein product, partial [Larinioides sclopetarius]
YSSFSYSFSLKLVLETLTAIITQKDIITTQVYHCCQVCPYSPVHTNLSLNENVCIQNQKISSKEY